MRSMWTALLVAGALSLAGCSRDAGYYVKDGNRLFEAEKYTEADLQYRKALQRDPNSGEAHYRLALIELKRNQLQEAYRQLSRAVDLMPDHTDAKVKLGEVCLRLYLGDPRRPKVFYDRLAQMGDQLLAKDANSFDGLRLKGSQAILDRRPKDAVGFFEKASRLKPSDAGLSLELAQALFQTERVREGEKLLQDLIGQQKTYLPAYDVLHRYYQESRRTADAGKLLELKATNNPKDAASLLQLALHHALAKRPAEMQAALQKILDNPQDFPRGRLLVGDFWSRIGNWEQAIREYEAGAQANPADKLMYQRVLANTWLGQNRTAEAQRILDEILREHPKDPEARTIRASLQIDPARPESAEAAIKELQAVAAERPDSPALQYQLGRAYQAKGDLKTARERLQEAANRSATWAEPRLALAEISLREGKPQESIRWTSAVLRLQGDVPKARVLRAAGLFAMGQVKEARQELTSVLQTSPQDRDAQVQLGLVAIAEKKFTEAEGIFRKLLQGESRDTRGALGLASIYSLQNQSGRAIEVLGEELKRQPDSVRMVELYGLVNAASGRYDPAIEQYQRLLTKDPSSSTLLTGLGELYLRKGDASNASAALEKAEKADAKNFRAVALLADALRGAGRLDESKAAYRRALALQPENLFLMNNLAFLLAETGGSLEEAQQLAQKAAQKAPEQTFFTDTLGVVYFRKRMFDSAQQVFAALVKKQPDNPSFRYHLGMTLMERGDKPNARRELETALAKKPSADEEAKIKELLARLG